MKKALILCSILLICASSAFALDISVTLPSGFDTAAVNTFTEQANKALADFDNMPELARGFGNAGTYITDAATFRGYGSYKIFHVSVGAMVGLQLPTNSLENIAGLPAQIAADRDIYAGAMVQALVFSAGFNASFLLDGLYFSVKFGKLPLKFDNLSYDSTMGGIMVDYQVFKDRSLLGLIKWNGLRVGTGFFYYHNEGKFNFNAGEIEIGSVDFNNGSSTESVTAYVDPSFTATIVSKGFQIPINIVTGMRFLWVLNLTIGLGADFNFGGSSEISLHADSEVNFIDSSGNQIATPGAVRINAGTDGNADWFRLRAIGGIGLSLGPVKIDIPISYYFDFDGKGLAGSFGLTGTVAF